MPESIESLTTAIRDLAAKVEALKQVRDEDDDRHHGRFVKYDLEKRLVYAEIYLPDTPDAHGHEMTREEVEKMAHNFMANARTLMIDINHDNKTSYGCALVESFIARDGDPDYVAGSWVGVAFIGSDDIWEKVKKGELTGFSFEGIGYVSDVDPGMP